MKIFLIYLATLVSFFSFSFATLAKENMSSINPVKLHGQRDKLLDLFENQSFLQSERNNIDIFKKRSPWVVFVNNVQVQRDFWSASVSEVPAGAGTGFLWDNKGHIITNYHVVRGSDRVTIDLKDGTSLKASIVGVEPRKDIAILKVDPKKIKGAGFSKYVANSGELVVGQKVLAIGNPFGLDQTLTTGVISALGRAAPALGDVTIRDMIQTDASINRGNSGGPLIDSSGKLIGMNTAIISPSGTSAGIGFAVPSNTIQRIATQLIKHGKVIQPGLGISLLPSSWSKAYDISGVVVRGVQRNSSAEKAGLRGIKRSRGNVKLGDIITEVDSKKVQDYDDLYNILEKRNVGDRVKIGFLRDGKKRTAQVKLQKIESY